MGRLILVTGGVRSGKSIFAENTVKSFGENVLYIATSIPLDDEMRIRIKNHRERRPECWETIEAYKDLHVLVKPIVSGKSAVLIDCVTVMVTNLLFDESVDWENIKDNDVDNLEKSVYAQIENIINMAENTDTPFVLVTNEVGMGIVPEYHLGRIFRDIAGKVNQMLANAAHEVYFCVSGIPMRIK